jgi:molybdenum cofactor cytidylyltransferase
VKTAALILAAGAGTRFGSTKQLVTIDHKPMLQWVIDSVKEICPNAIYSVIGSDAASLRNQIVGTHFIENKQWSAGLGGSIALGVNHLKSDFERIFILLADQPRVRAQHLQQLMAAYDDRHIVCSCYGDSLGVPAIFGRKHFAALTGLAGDTGAKAMLTQLQPPAPSICLEGALEDIDTVDDLARLQATFVSVNSS